MFKLGVSVQKFEHIVKLVYFRQEKTFIFNNTRDKLTINNNVSCFSSNSSNVVNSDEIDYAAIVNGDQELEHKLKVLVLEAEVLRQDGKMVPDSSFFKPEHWKELLKLESRSARQKYLQYLFKTWKTIEHRNEKKKEKQLAYEEAKIERKEKLEKETLEDFFHTYDLSHNSIFLRFRDSTINDMYNNRLIQAIRFGQKLIIDCGFDENMTKRENINAAKQLMLLFAENRFHKDPYDLHFCNMNQNGNLFPYLLKNIPTLMEKWFPLNVHECSYLDLFPREKLVYLTPHCQQVLNEYDHDDIYIIGGIVDRSNNEPLSLAKAKKEGIRMAKFPLDKYLQWGSGSGKSLTVNQSVSILLDLKTTNDWMYSLRHVPRRKLVELESSYSIQNDRKRIVGKWSPKANPRDRKKLIKNLFNDY